MAGTMFGEFNRFALVSSCTIFHFLLFYGAECTKMHWDTLVWHIKEQTERRFVYCFWTVYSNLNVSVSVSIEFDCANENDYGKNETKLWCIDRSVALLLF